VGAAGEVSRALNVRRWASPGSRSRAESRCVPRWRHGRGEHRLGFTHGRFAMGVYSGHGGFGDVCWVDNLLVRGIEALTEAPLPLPE